jgi:hypothetical protein
MPFKKVAYGIYKAAWTVIPDKRAPHWRTGRTTPAEKAGFGLSPAIE